jgi:hypothetical protein
MIVGAPSDLLHLPPRQSPQMGRLPPPLAVAAPQTYNKNSNSSFAVSLCSCPSLSWQNEDFHFISFHFKQKDGSALPQLVQLPPQLPLVLFLLPVVLLRLQFAHSTFLNDINYSLLLIN